LNILEQTTEHIRRHDRMNCACSSSSKVN